MWAKIEHAAGDGARARELMAASVALPGCGPAAVHAAAKFVERTAGGARAARQLYERALAMDSGHAPSLQVRISICTSF